MPIVKLSEKQREEIQKLYNAHNSIRSIAAKFKVDRQTIYYHLGLTGRSNKGKWQVFTNGTVKIEKRGGLRIGAGRKGKPIMYADYLKKYLEREKRKKLPQGLR